MTHERQRGMTLIELMVAMALTLVAASASYTLFVGQSRLMKQTQSTVEMQDNARIATEMVTRDIRNAGFMVPTAIAVQIEDDCGNTANDLNYNSATSTFKIGGAGTAAVTDGEILGTTEIDRCPNGSDRLIVVSRPRIDFAQGAGGPGNSLQLDVNCPGNNCNLVFTNGGITGTNCTTAGTRSDPVTLCSVGDPFSCQEVTVEPKTGAGGCSTCTYPTCTLMVYAYPSGSPFQASASWDAIGGKFGAGFQAWQYRIYQLMDVDADGSTELVFSDNANALMRAGTAGAQSATWNVIANNIDDFQVSYAKKSAPLTYSSKSIFIYPGCNEAGTGGWNNGYDCGTEVDSEAGDDPIGAVRVSIVARSPSKQRTPNGGFANYERGGVENNAPASANANNVETTAVAGRAPGCGTPINFATCTGNGNAPGFNRRIITQAITTRNTQ